MSPWRDIAVIKISPRRWLRHGAKALAVWRRPSPRLCNRPSTGTYAIQEMAGWRNKKGKSGSVATLSSSKKGLTFSHRWQQKSSGYPNRRGCRATAMLSLLFCRALVILVALPRYASPTRNSSRATARYLVVHLVVQCKLSRPISPFRDRNRDFGRDSRRQGCATGPLISKAIDSRDPQTFGFPIPFPSLLIIACWNQIYL